MRPPYAMRRQRQTKRPSRSCKREVVKLFRAFVFPKVFFLMFFLGGVLFFLMFFVCFLCVFEEVFFSKFFF